MIEFLKEFYKNDTIESINLRGNDLSVQNCEVLSDILSKNSTLKYLDLSGNFLFLYIILFILDTNLFDEHFNILSTCFLSNTSLEYLDLDGK